MEDHELDFETQQLLLKLKRKIQEQTLSLEFKEIKNLMGRNLPSLIKLKGLKIHLSRAEEAQSELFGIYAQEERLATHQHET